MSVSSFYQKLSKFSPFFKSAFGSLFGPLLINYHHLGRTCPRGHGEMDRASACAHTGLIPVTLIFLGF